MNLTKVNKKMINDELIDDVIEEPTDDELEEIETELEEENPFEISDDEYEDTFGNMVDLDKGLFGAKHRENLQQVKNYYNS